MLVQNFRTKQAKTSEIQKKVLCMAKSYYRPSLVLPMEAEEQLRSLAGELKVDRQDLMREAVLAVIDGRATVTISKDCGIDEELVSCLTTLERNAPSTRAALDRLIVAAAKETAIDARNRQSDADARSAADQLNRATARITGGPGASDPSTAGAVGKNRRAK
jgi:hypothetical protein